MDQKRSSLNSKTGKFMGFGISKHPLKKSWFLETDFYKVDDQWIICFAEGNKLNEKAKQNLLGKKINGNDFSPYAQRSIEKLSFEDFKKMMTETMSEFTFHWSDE